MEKCRCGGKKAPRSKYCCSQCERVQKEKGKKIKKRCLCCGEEFILLEKDRRIVWICGVCKEKGRLHNKSWAMI